MISFIFDNIANPTCIYEKLAFAVAKEYAGENVGMKKGSVDDCKKYCDSVPNCHSFDYQKKKKECYLKDKQLNGNEPLECWDSMFTVYKDCIQGTK